jgi:hypothetical protein
MPRALPSALSTLHGQKPKSNLFAAKTLRYHIAARRFLWAVV